MSVSTRPRPLAAQVDSVWSEHCVPHLYRELLTARTTPCPLNRSVHYYVLNDSPGVKLGAANGMFLPVCTRADIL